MCFDMCWPSRRRYIQAFRRQKALKAALMGGSLGAIGCVSASIMASQACRLSCVCLRIVKWFVYDCLFANRKSDILHVGEIWMSRMVCIYIYIYYDTMSAA